MVRDSEECTDTIAELASIIEHETKIALRSIDDEFKNTESPFTRNFGDLFLKFIQTRVRTVYNEFVLSLALKRHSLNAANGMVASFSNLAESTRHNTVLKRKYSDTIDASNQILPTKRRRMIAYEEIACDTDDEDTVNEADGIELVNSDEDTNVYDTVDDTTVKSAVDEVSSCPVIEPELIKANDYEINAFNSTRIVSQHQKQNNEPSLILTATKEFSVTPDPTKIPIKKYIQIASSTPVSSRITSYDTTISAPMPPPKATKTAWAKIVRIQPDISTENVAAPTKTITRATIASNQTDDSTRIETSTRNKTTLNEASTSNSRMEYTCDQCDFRSVHKGHHQRHKDIHMRKPFKCQTCQKKFEAKELLELHNIQTHKKQPEQSICELCQKTAYNLKRHMKIVHNK